MLRSSVSALVIMAALVGVSSAYAQDEEGVVIPAPPPVVENVRPTESPMTSAPAVVVQTAPAVPDKALPIPSEIKREVKKQKEKKAAVSQDRTEKVITALLADKNSTASGLTIADALREAYVGNPTLRAARAAVQSAYEKKPQAIAGFQPNVDVAADITAGRVDTDLGDAEQDAQQSVGVTLSQSLYRGGRNIAAVGVADAEIDAQLAMLATTERAILFQTARAYMDVLRAQANVRVNEKNRDVIARQLRATNDRFDVGDVTRTDVAQSQFRLARAEAELTASVGDLRTARAVFEQLVGLSPERLALPERMFKFPAKMDDAVTMAETYNPDVIMAQALHAAAEQNIDVEFGAILPELTFDASASATRDPVGAAYDSGNAVQAGVTFRMPLYEGGALRSRVRQAEHTANQKYMSVLEARRSAREEAVRSWENLAAARAEMTSRESQVRAAETARAGVREEAEVGGRTILDALDADQEVRDAQIALITAKRNEIVAEYALASAMGLLLPGNVGIKESVFPLGAVDTTDPDRAKRVGGQAF